MNIKQYIDLVKKTSDYYEFKKIGNIDKNEINDLTKNGVKICFLRHDIDYSIENALKIAEIESNLNIFSTFTVLLSGSTYNPLQKKSREIKNHLKSVVFFILLFL